MIAIENTGYENIKELDGIEEHYTGKDIMRSICYSIRWNYKKIYNAPFTTLIFNGVIADRYPSMLASLIKRAGLGELMQTKSKVNPNSENVIRVYVWHVDKKALSKWFKKNRYKNEEDNEYGIIG